MITLLMSGGRGYAQRQRPADVHLEHGYTLLLQAQRDDDVRQRELHLIKAIAAFKKAYQAFGRMSKVQALIGAAQAYLLLPKSKPVFPFLWQATPLQRAEKSLWQALFLQPGNGAATLLLGLVYRRQALAAPPRQAEKRQRSRTYFARAAAAGLPVRLSGGTRQANAISLFDASGVVLLLRYIDAHGDGRVDDLLFVYRSTAASTAIFGVVVSEGRSYPLVADRASGTLRPAGTLAGLRVVPQSQGWPIITITVGQETRLLEEAFSWNGSRFIFLGDRPASP
jgi:hypothetical protein